MKLSHRAYPHPVVGNGDDVVDTAFQAPVEVYDDGINYFVKVQVQCSSRTINKLVERGDAVFVLHVECGNTFYRAAFEFSDPTKEIMIEGENLNATVELNVVARAKTDQKRYRVENAHEDYEDAVFSIAAGDILAIAEGHSFDADINFDTLRSVSSIMQVRESDDADDCPMIVDLNDDKITILLSRVDFTNYKIIRSDKILSASLIATLVLPALVESLACIQADDAEYEETRWFRCLKRRIDNLGLSPDMPPLELAQRILELPIRRSFMSACSYLEAKE